jgi:hypothetical protein
MVAAFHTRTMLHTRFRLACASTAHLSMAGEPPQSVGSTGEGSARVIQEPLAAWGSGRPPPGAG